jgi:4-amino-4-deoxy-L-arabinose transferase-like glycosyltransferase
MSSFAERVSAKPLRTVVLLGLLLFLSGNWILPLMDRDEPRFAEASREMVQRGDMIIPWFNGEYRFDKPPLIYWCQIGWYRLLGENPFAARLPSVLFAVATAALLVVWGRRLGNEKAGFYAAIMLMTCLQFLIHARLAVADMPMILFVTISLWSGWEMTRPQPKVPTAWWWLFYLSQGLGFLAKGPVAWLPLGGLILARWMRPANFSLPAMRTVLGVVVALGIVGLWGVPALIATHGQFFSVGIGHHVVYRSLGIMEGHGGPGWVGFLLTLPLYLVTFFLSFFPWSFKVPGTLRRWWSSRNEDTFGAYLLVQAALVFAVFSLVRTKLPHYILPAFPVVSLWLALQLADKPGSLRSLTRAAAAMCLLNFAVTLPLFRAARPKFVAASLHEQARPLCSPDMEFATTGFDEPSLVWEFRKDLTNYMQRVTLEQAGAFLDKPGPRILIVQTSQAASQLSGLISSNSFKTFRSAGLDTARFRRIDLTAIVKTTKQ